MVEPRAVSIAGTGASKLLEQVMEATKIAISCNKSCKVLRALLMELQPIVDHAVRQISQSNFDNAFERPRSAVHDWLDELEGTLKRAAVEVNKCIKQQLVLNPVSRYNTGKRILDVTESVKKLLQQAALVGLAVTLSGSSPAQNMEKMMQEIHQMIATVAQESLQEKYTTSSAQGILSAIKSALHNLLQSLPLRPSDNNDELDQVQLNYELDQVQLNDELDQVQLNDELDQVQLNDELDQVQLNDELDQVQLNEELCRYLHNVLVDILDDAGKDLSSSKRDDRERALKELDSVVKRAESLIRKCMCKDSSWLDAAITLANIKEEILEIQLELSWWANMVEIASVQDLDSGESVVQNAVKAMRKQSALLEELVKEGSSLQRAAEVDKKNLVSKLLGVKEEHAKEEDDEYVLSVYLLSQMKEDTHIVEMVRSKLKDVTWDEPLGNGSSGAVTGVTWFQRKCAVKSVKSYEKEVKTLSRCNHPHIVQFLWHWEQPSRAYIMMERMPQDLQRHIEAQAHKRGRQPFELHVANDIMLQVAKAVQYLHNKNIVHRDLKTSNILVDDSTEGYVLVKLADFGLAKTYDRTQTVSTQTIGGTTRYAAPEVNIVDRAMIHRKKTIKFLPKADVWSFAMVCSEILTGNIPFTGMDVKQSEIHDKIAEPNFRPPLPNDPCFDYLRFCITSCWSHDQEKRPDFSTICQMLKLAKMLAWASLPLTLASHYSLGTLLYGWIQKMIILKAGWMS